MISRFIAKKGATGGAVLCLIVGTAVQAQVSIESLLNEMVDRDSVARFPEHDFRLKEFSSYDRRSKTPADPKGWFGNYDFNIGEKARNFVRIEKKDGRKEWVLMDHQGPGVVVRSWMPFGKVPEGVMIRLAQRQRTHPVSFRPPVPEVGGFLFPDPFCEELQGNTDGNTASFLLHLRL
jgi:hypothetical protein